ARRRKDMTGRCPTFHGIRPAKAEEHAVRGRFSAMQAILRIVLVGAVLGCGAAAAASPEMLARGKALVDAADCASCHTDDPAKPLAGGKRIDTPFGGIFAPNLTPDRGTGLDAWTDDEFYRALHDGVARDGARYYPAF